jgi:hypothetical protein
VKVKGRVQAIRSIRQQFSDVADPHKREKLINAAMKKSKIYTAPKQRGFICREKKD